MAVKPSKVIDDITHPNPVFIISVWHKMMEWPLLLSQRARTTRCIANFFIRCSYHGFMKMDLRISIKDYRRNKSLKVLLFRAPWPGQFLVRMNGERWPARKGGFAVASICSFAERGGEGG
jgi:hypothetical protein